MVAVGVLLPLITSHGFGVQGTVLLPMHIPVLLSGLLLGPRYGLMVGLVTPALSCLLTSMPPVYPMLPIMLCELAVYGLASGLLAKKFSVHISLIGAMLSGRLTYAAVFYALLLNDPDMKALSVTAAVTTGIAGIVIQVILIPPLALILRGPDKDVIREKKFDCVVKTADGRRFELKGDGVKPLLEIPDGDLKDAKVYDKIVGKAVAAVCVHGGVRKVYGKVMSRAAAEYLKRYNIPRSYDILVEYIKNRAGDGVCPIEAAVAAADDPAEGLRAVQTAVSALRQSVQAVS
jgi:uncharacterized membrane protein